MILQALNEYYQRKAADPESNIAPDGFEWKEIPFVIVIENEGRFVTLEDTREGEGRKKQAKRFLVPAAEKRTTGVKANLLWDNIEYALGANPRQRTDVKERQCAFLEKIDITFSDGEARAIVAPLLAFLRNDPIKEIKSVPSLTALWEEAYQVNANVIFRIHGSKDNAITDTLRPYIGIEKNNGAHSICLVTGESGSIARLHASIKGVRGAQSSGAALISFNLSPFESYGKTQNFNSPISEPAAFAYTTALNTLLGIGSNNKVRIGDTTTVFWAQRHTDFEDDFAAFFSFAPKDDPDADARAVKNLYSGIYSGKIAEDSTTRFYVLGLAPNAARLSIRFWHSGTIAEISGSLKMHFDDMEIIRSSKDTGHYSLFWILSAMAQESKVDNIPPNLAGQIVQAILNGTAYPVTMLHQTIRRIRATQNVSRGQAAILKGVLNRFHRVHSTKEKEITVAIDLDNNNPGYRLGRLFAILEKIQEEANPGINATIRDRFYGAAASSPVTVFPQLLKLKNHHLAKLPNVGRKVNFERMLADVFSGIGSEMPAHLAMEDQARFAIGYYHQRQSLFEKS